VNDGSNTGNTDAATEIDTDGETDIDSDDAGGSEPYYIEIPSDGGRLEDSTIGASRS
jgi:hypothetical protein